MPSTFKPHSNYLGQVLLFSQFYKLGSENHCVRACGTGGVGLKSKPLKLNMVHWSKFNSGHRLDFSKSREDLEARDTLNTSCSYELNDDTLGCQDVYYTNHWVLYIACMWQPASFIYCSTSRVTSSRIFPLSDSQHRMFVVDTENSRHPFQPLEPFELSAETKLA